MATWPTSPFARPTGSFNLPVLPPAPAGGLCNSLQVTFPAEWAPYILAALEQLTLQATWQGSRAVVEATQQEAWFIIQLFQAAQCVSQPESTAMCCEDDMGCGCFRVMNGQLQQFCCGEWVNIDGAIFNGSGQPGGGSPQPQPGGGAADYCFKMPGSGQRLLPTLVNTGDTILISQLDGASSDGEIAFPGQWFCPTGRRFILGGCTGSFAFQGDNPLPGTPDMQLIAYIGSTPYAVCNLDSHDVPQVFTIPAGIVNQQVTFALNDNAPSGNQGDVSFCAHVVNNQAAAWSHVFDFTISEFTWVPSDDGFGAQSNYTPGTGFTSVFDIPHPPDSALGCQVTFPATTITRVEVFYQTDQDNNGGGTREVAYIAGGPLSVYGALDTGVGTFDTILTNTVAGVTELRVEIDRGNALPHMNAVCSKVIVSGLGVDPF